ncbi:MAG: sodium:proton antiporter [Bacteroidaceae bacterium]|nr:sodium:proton antiporter [Bacteroidaceae bacterium]
MTIAILSLILIGYVLISNEHVTNINKATIALFVGVVGWILFICTGMDFILKMHGTAFAAFADGAAATSELVKEYIARHVFIRYAADLGGVALFLLATMNIASVLNANGCFDFITDLVRTKDSRVLLWGLVGFTCLLSANLDNLTTTVLMLMIMKNIIQQTRWRMWIGSAIVIAANCSGATTVIGDITSLFVWTKGAITPTDFTAALVLPALIAIAIPTALIGRALPAHIEIVRPSTRYRGDQNTLRLWQRILLLVVGLGGLWFIPTYHRITHLPPFLGAMCVLGVLWVVHEIMNRRRIRSGQPLDARIDLHFQFVSMQTILYVVGIFLCVSLLIETGIMSTLSAWCDEWIHNIYIMSVAMGLISAVLDNIALVLTAINIYPVATDAAALATANALDPVYAESFVQNGQYWHLIIYSGCVAGCLLPIGNLSGYALMKAEDVSMAWYIRHIMPKVLLGWLVGLGTYFIVDLWLR